MRRPNESARRLLLAMRPCPLASAGKKGRSIMIGFPVWHHTDLGTHAKFVALAEVELNEQAGIGPFSDPDWIKSLTGKGLPVRSKNDFAANKIKRAKGATPPPRVLSREERAEERRQEKIRASVRAADVAQCAEVKRKYYEHSPMSERIEIETMFRLGREIAKAKRQGRFVKGGAA